MDLALEISLDDCIAFDLVDSKKHKKCTNPSETIEFKMNELDTDFRPGFHQNSSLAARMLKSQGVDPME